MQTATLKQSPKPSSDTTAPATIHANTVMAVSQARCVIQPFKHWLFKDLLPPAVYHDIIALPIEPASIPDTYGKRDSHNDVRRFFSPSMQERYPVMRTVADIFQSDPVVRAIEKLCGVSFKESYLRIEYCQDKDGFWLEPHMDIKEKYITLQIYLNTASDAATLGTDLYDKDKKPFSAAPSLLGDGMAFLPREPASWHGFEKRPIADTRRSLIINYVTDDWRSRHELSFPDQKIS